MPINIEHLRHFYDNFVQYLIFFGVIGFLGISSLSMLHFGTDYSFDDHLFFSALSFVLCIIFVTGLTKLLYVNILYTYCYRNENEERERERDRHYDFKVEFIGVLLHFIIIASLGAISFYAHVSNSIYIALAYAVAILLPFRCLRLAVVYLIEYAPDRVPVPPNHARRNDPDFARKVCVKLMNWFLHFITIGALGTVSWYNYDILHTLANYPILNTIFACSAITLIIVFVAGLASMTLYCIVNYTTFGSMAHQGPADEPTPVEQLIAVIHRTEPATPPLRLF